MGIGMNRLGSWGSEKDSSEDTPMLQVLLFESDPHLRPLLHQLLRGAGYTAQDADDMETALATVRDLAPGNLVVVCGNGDPRSQQMAMPFFTQVAAETAYQRHVRYLFLTTVPESMPSPLATTLARLHIPVIKKPFDADELLEAIATAAAQISATTRISARVPPQPGNDGHETGIT